MSQNYKDFFENDRPMLHEAHQGLYSMRKDDKYNKVDEQGRAFTWGKGSRKRSKSTVRLYPGSGKIRVNNRDFTEYFAAPHMRFKVVLPLSITGTACDFDIQIRVYGGGINCQADAAQAAIVKVISS
jgi:small subunit ribosomal protein S9